MPHTCGAPVCVCSELKRSQRQSSICPLRAWQAVTAQYVSIYRQGFCEDSPPQISFHLKVFQAKEMPQRVKNVCYTNLTTCVWTPESTMEGENQLGEVVLWNSYPRHPPLTSAPVSSHTNIIVILNNVELKKKKIERIPEECHLKVVWMGMLQGDPEARHMNSKSALFRVKGNDFWGR